MNIYIIINNISRIGGTERAVANLSSLLLSNHNVSIISLASHSQDKPYYTIDNGINIQHMGMMDLQSGLKSKIKWLLKVRNNLKSLDFPVNSVVVGTGHNINTAIGLCKFDKKGIKTIACEHIQIDTIPTLSRMLMRLTYKKLDKIVVLSNSAKQKAINVLHLEHKLSVIPNSLPFNPITKSHLNNHQIIMVGRLSQEKGYERVVKVASFLKSHYPDWNISIYGSGVLKKQLEELFKNNGLNNVVIFDPVINIDDKYLESSIFMMTSYNEAMPMVILEANSCGLPAIAFECEGSKELIRNGENGYLIRNNDFDEFNYKLSTMIDSIDLRRKLGESAYLSSLQYSKDNIRDLWNELFQN